MPAHGVALSAHKTAKVRVEPRAWLISRIQTMMGMLGLQFVLGMLLNTIGQPDASTGHGVSVLWHVILWLHIFVALGLLANAVYILYFSSKHYWEMQKVSLIALLGIVAAAVFGALTASGFHRELMSFGMAMSFLIAISIYGNSLSTK